MTKRQNNDFSQIDRSKKKISLRANKMCPKYVNIALELDVLYIGLFTTNN